MQNKQENKLWGGRFSANTSKLLEDYTQSVSFDKALYKEDIAGSKAHAKMLAIAQVLTTQESNDIVVALNKIQTEIENGKFNWQVELEDVHMNIESRLTDLIGNTGKKLHTARSRNDQVALDFRLFVSNNLRLWHSQLLNLIAVLNTLAKEHKATLLPGYTHLQPAQAVSLAQHFLAYANMFKRDAERVIDCEKRTRICPLGAAALAGTTYDIDPVFIANELEMYGVFNNSMDAVSDRDFVLEALFCASTIMTHLSRFCEEIILWSNPNFNYIKIADSHSTGSSIMPQKKNPDIAELMRGKVGRVYGNLNTLLTIIKGLPLTYNRDLQEDKEPFFDSNKQVQASLIIMADMLENITINKKAMHKALKLGYINATELADYLVTKGIAFREAHHITGQIVAFAESKNKALEDLELSTMQNYSKVIEKDIFQVLNYKTAVNRRKANGGTAISSVAKQIKNMQAWLNKQAKIYA